MSTSVSVSKRATSPAIPRWTSFQRVGSTRSKPSPFTAVPPTGGVAAICGASDGWYASAVNSMRETWSGRVNGTLAAMIASAASASGQGASGRRLA